MVAKRHGERSVTADASGFGVIPTLKYLRLHELDIQYSRQLRRLRRILKRAEKKALEATPTTDTQSLSEPRSSSLRKD